MLESKYFGPHYVYKVIVNLHSFKLLQRMFLDIALKRMFTSVANNLK